MPVRVLLYANVNPADRGGVQAIVHRLASHFRLRGHSVVTLWPLPHPDPAGGNTTCALPPLVWRRGFPAPRSAVNVARACLRLAWRLLRYRPHVVNVHFVSAEARYFVWLRGLFRYRLLLSAHGSDVLRPEPENERLLPRILARADGITAVSDLLATRIVEQLGGDSSRVRRIPNGIDYGFWSTPICAGDASSGPPTVLSVGRLDPVKGHDVLLEAFARVRQRARGARLVIAGDGGFRIALEGLADRLGVRDAVDFPGQLDGEGVRKRMAEARLFVLPSRSEGLPLAPLEAMAAGLPVVASHVGGVAEILTPATGVLVPPEDPVTLADAIADLLLHPNRAADLIGPARLRARRFSAAASDEAYARVLCALISAPDVSALPEERHGRPTLPSG